MFNHLSVRRTTAYLVIGALSLLALGLGMAPVRAVSGSDSQALRKLLEERKALLRQAVGVAVEEHRAGRIDLDSVLTLRRDLLNAELELAASREERIELYGKLVEHARAWENTTAELYKSGGATQVDVLKAKAARLRSQIDLERAKLKDD